MSDRAKHKFGTIERVVVEHSKKRKSRNPSRSSSSNDEATPSSQKDKRRKSRKTKRRRSSHGESNSSNSGGDRSKSSDKQKKLFAERPNLHSDAIECALDNDRSRNRNVGSWSGERKGDQKDIEKAKKLTKYEKQRSSATSNIETDADSSLSSGGTSSDSDTSSDESRKKRKRRKSAKKKKLAKRMKKKEEKKRKKEKRKLKKIMKDKMRANVKGMEHGGIEEPQDRLLKDINVELADRARAMAPMTKEEWEKKCSVIRRVYDEETGRHRLIKGDGEVLEEIVSKERHIAINKQATKGDGEFFQSRLRVNK